MPALIGGGFLLLFVAGMVYLVADFINSAEKPQAPRVQKISLIKPPPPKPPEEPPPEPEKIEEPEEEVPIEEPPPDAPEAANDEPPPGEDLAVEGEGGAGNDGFGLLGKKGVRELGGRGGDREAWYGRVISRHFEDGLRRSKRLKDNDYRVTLQVWFDAAGVVRKVLLERSTGDAATDAAIKDELMSLQPLREALPVDLPQPVRIRLASRA